MPEYFEPLRQEIGDVTDRLGWTKDAIDSMPKIDSFIRESQRMNGLGTRKFTSNVRSCPEMHIHSS